ncbi:MAG: ABC transporter ATP-binding protein [Candidatus Sedimenticola endophacoides]
MNGQAVIELDRLGFSYGEAPVLEEVSLRVLAGEFIGVVGPNAGGKSTLLKLILGLLQPATGKIRVFGRSPGRARWEIGYVPQYPTFQRDFPISVEQTVLMGRLARHGLFGRYRREDMRAAERAMERTEVRELAGRQINTLSGGQLQRVLLARALACEPRMLILDEPTANIDQRLECDIFDLLKGFNRSMSILVVSHDIGFISRYVDRVACLNCTLICHKTEAIDGQTISELYGSDVRMVAHQHF